MISISQLFDKVLFTMIEYFNLFWFTVYWIKLKEMSKEQIKQFLCHGTFTAKICTISKDGSPHVAPVWFLVEDYALGDMVIVFMTYYKSAKSKHLLTDSS